MAINKEAPSKWRRFVSRLGSRAAEPDAREPSVLILPWEAEPTDSADFDLERHNYRQHARMLGIGFADLLRFFPAEETFRLLPTWVMHQHRVVPLGKVAGVLFCTVADPSDRDALHVASRCVEGPVHFVLATPRDIEHTLWAHFKAKPSQTEADRHRPAAKAQAVAP